MKTVHQLRKEGNKVQVFHKRRYYDPVNKRYWFLTAYDRSVSALPDYVKMEQKGGETTIIINNELVGMSDCSRKDNYCKKAGVKLALQRALNSDLTLEESKV